MTGTGLRQQSSKMSKTFFSLVANTEKYHALVLSCLSDRSRTPFLPGNRVILVSTKLRMSAGGILVGAVLTNVWRRASGKLILQLKRCCTHFVIGMKHSVGSELSWRK